MSRSSEHSVLQISFLSKSLKNSSLRWLQVFLTYGQRGGGVTGASRVSEAQKVKLSAKSFIFTEKMNPEKFKQHVNESIWESSQVTSQKILFFSTKTPTKTKYRPVENPRSVESLPSETVTVYLQNFKIGGGVWENSSFSLKKLVIVLEFIFLANLLFSIGMFQKNRELARSTCWTALK